MPRPRKWRRICTMPPCTSFGPEKGKRSCVVEMTVDEYEAIRLIDHEGLKQEECADQMEVARTTVQAIYASARKKLAACIVEGNTLVIGGGEYRMCDHLDGRCGKGCCHGRCDKHQSLSKRKRRTFMKVAVCYEDGQVFQHFGKTQLFKVYDIEDGAVVKTDTIDPQGEGHGALGGVLQKAQVDALICGGIGGGAKTMLAQAGISLYSGVSGSADEAAEALAAGTLEFNPDIECGHHDHHHGNCHH